MAVLHLLLQHNAAVRSIPELAKVCDSHAWVENKKFLLVPYHMIGARSMESAILGGYVDYVQDHHPGCPLPGVYLADEIFENAKQLRERLGDEKFFEDLNGRMEQRMKEEGGRRNEQRLKEEGGRRNEKNAEIHPSSLSLQPSLPHPSSLSLQPSLPQPSLPQPSLPQPSPKG
jgi:hypothetical protein